MKNEEKSREAWVRESRFYLGDNKILNITIVGEVDEKTAAKMLDTVVHLREIIAGKVDVLIDLNKAGRTSSGARKIGIERFQDKKVGKVALWNAGKNLYVPHSLGN